MRVWRIPPARRRFPGRRRPRAANRGGTRFGEPLMLRGRRIGLGLPSGQQRKEDFMFRIVCLRWCVAASLAAALVQPRVQAGPDFIEPCDAGSLPGSATATDAPGPSLKSIRGTLAVCMNGPESPGDFEDMFIIIINQPTIFCCKTVAIPDSHDCCNNAYPVL